MSSFNEKLATLYICAYVDKPHGHVKEKSLSPGKNFQDFQMFHKTYLTRIYPKVISITFSFLKKWNLTSKVSKVWIFALIEEIHP